MGKPLSVFIDTTIKFFAAKEILFNLHKQGVELKIYCPQEAMDTVRTSFADDVSIIDFQEVLKHNRFIRKVYSLLFQAGTHKHSTYLARARFKTLPIITKFLCLVLTPAFWFCSNNKINNRIQKLFNRFVSNPFDTKAVVVVSRPHEKVTFCAKDLSVITIQESWDHPFQAPLGYCSDLVITWNRGTAESWIKLQGDDHVIIGFPEKLSYATKNSRRSPSETSQKIKRVLYPLTFCSESSHEFFNEELTLVQLIADALSEHSVLMYVKPKPNAHPNELDYLRSTHPDVEIGHFNQQSANTYTLSRSYNLKRLNEIESTDLVINLGTTFGLDASAIGKPVLQLKITDNLTFPNLSELTKYDHLKSVFYRHDYHLFDIEEKQDISQLAKQLDHLASSQGQVYSEYLNEWLLSDVRFSSWIKDCCKKIEALNS